jgi:hypothetical protein
MCWIAFKALASITRAILEAADRDSFPMTLCALPLHRTLQLVR